MKRDHGQRRTRLTVGLLLLPLASVTAAAHAQGTFYLSNALETVRWNPAERGPLIAVDAGRVPLVPAAAAHPPPHPLPTNLATLASLFGRRVVPVGEIHGSGPLTVLAPETAEVLNLHPDAPTPTGLSRGAALHRLLQGFDEAQWRKVGNGGGIGAGDMETDVQRTLFRALSESPLPITRYTSGAPASEHQTLRPAQLTGLRFRIQRTVDLSMTATGPDGTIYVGIGIPASRSPESPHLGVDDTAARQQEKEASGTWTVRSERNRPKRGDLDFMGATLDPTVRLTGLGTVGDAVKACAAATHQELYVDGRMGRLPLSVRATDNATVRAGDLLRGLCWMLTGTFRRVGVGNDTALVLTDDLAGYGPRFARLRQIRFQQNVAMNAAFEAEPDQAVPGSKIWGLLSDSDDIGFTPTGAIRDLLDSGRPVAGGLSLAPAAFPEVIRQRLAKAPEQYAALKGFVHQPLNQDRVSVGVHSTMEYLVSSLPPIVGESVEWLFRTAAPRTVAPEPGPVPAPLSAKMSAGLTLLAAPGSVEAAETLVRIAADNGIPHLWLEADPDVVQAAVGIAARQSPPITVSAMVSVLRRPKTPEETTLPRDLDLFGQETDWLLPDAPETQTIAQNRLRTYAKIPGLAGLILTDTAAPGCGVSMGDSLSEDNFWQEAGYTPARRLAFLRKFGFDPIDFIPPLGLDNPLLPFLQDHLGWEETTAARDVLVFRAHRGWGAMRGAPNLALMRSLYDTVRQAAAPPTLPLMVRGRGAEEWYWYGSWDTPETPPYFARSSPTPARPKEWPTFFQIVHAQSRRNLLGIVYRPGQYLASTTFAPLPDNGMALARAVNWDVSARGGDWDGLVLDLRTVPVSVLPALLTGSIARGR